MQTLHIANTFFEWELSASPKSSPYAAFHQHPVFLQLQFLPLLYADQADVLFVSDLPPESYWENIQQYGLHPVPIFSHNIPSSPHLKIESWGASRLIAQWAKAHGISYAMPDWDVVKEVNSKVFSFSHSPLLPGATLLHNESEARKWMMTLQGDKVLKTAFGVSGRGHLHIKNPTVPWDAVLHFLHSEWDQDRAVIAEPWVERSLDFSTQWFLEKTGGIVYVGATLCCNDERGRYRSNRVGNETDLFGDALIFLEEHKSYAREMLQRISRCGYFGHVGCDAMVYRMPCSTDRLLQPIVEINARKTMGWAALQFQQKHFPDQCIALSYLPTQQGHLPSQLLLPNGKKVHFSRNLNLQLISVQGKN